MSPERVDTPEAFLALRLRVRELERQVEEAKSAAARTCYQGGAAAGELLAAADARAKEALSHLPPVARGDTVTLPRSEYEAARSALGGTVEGKASVFQTAALAARAYLVAHAALVDAGTTPERPDAARRLADAWIALTKACAEIQPVGGPAPAVFDVARINTMCGLPERSGIPQSPAAQQAGEAGGTAAPCNPGSTRSPATATGSELRQPSSQAAPEGSGYEPGAGLAIDRATGEEIDLYAETAPDGCTGDADCEVCEPAPAPAPRSGIPLLDHAFVPTAWSVVDACDKRVSDDGRNSRQCGRPRKEHQAEEGAK